MVCKDPGSPDFQQWQDKERLIEIRETESGFIAKQAERDGDGRLRAWIDAELFLVDDSSLMLYLEDEHPIERQIIPFRFMFHRQPN